MFTARKISIAPSPTAKIAKLTNTELSPLEEAKATIVLGLDGMTLDGERFEAFVTERMGDANCEKLGGKKAGYSVRLAGKHRICFDINLKTAGMVYVTTTAIGDSTYSH